MHPAGPGRFRGCLLCTHRFSEHRAWDRTRRLAFVGFVGGGGHRAVAFLAGELAAWPSKHAMAAILRSAGLRVVVGSYSIRVEGAPASRSNNTAATWGIRSLRPPPRVWLSFLRRPFWCQRHSAERASSTGSSCTIMIPTNWPAICTTGGRCRASKGRLNWSYGPATGTKTHLLGRIDTPTRSPFTGTRGPTRPAYCIRSFNGGGAVSR